MIRHAAALLLAGAALCAPRGAAGQAPVQPGGVATVVAAVPARAGVDSARFELAAAPDVRVFGRGAGMVAAGARLPFTFGLPAAATAGRLVVARLELAWPDGARDSLELAVEIAARHAATFWLGAESITTTPGAPLRVGFRLQNRGNAVDTFAVVVDGPRGWDARPVPATVVLAPGDTATGTVRLAAPAGARPGEEHLVRVGLSGRNVLESRSFQAFVLGEEGWLGGVAHVPGTVFVGSSSDIDGLPGVSLDAAGEARPGVNVAVALRHPGTLEVAPALRGRLTGPRLRVGISTPDWDLTLGDVFTPADVLNGPVSQGRGVQATVRHQELTAELMVAAPLSYGLDGESGLITRAAASLGTPLGRFGVQAASVRRESALFGRDERAGAALTWNLRRPGHELTVKAGLLGVADTASSSAGFTGTARYLHTFDRGTVTARLRAVPATTRAGAGSGNEAFLSGTFDVSRSASLVGWGFLGSSPLADGSPHAASRAGAAGVRVRLPLDIDAEALATYRESRMVGDTLPAGITRAARFTVGLPVAALALEADAEIGTVSAADTRPFRQLRAGARWAARRQWAWIGLAHYDFGTGTPLTALDLAGALAVRRVDVQGGLNVPLSGGDPSLWTSATVPVNRHIHLSMGVDHRPSSLTAPWRVSLGVGRTFGLPLPLPRQPALHGRVFEDLDGDRLRDEGEPWLEGISLVLGPVRARTDALGAFAFYDGARGALRLDATALAAGYVIPAEVALPGSGRVEVPLIRAASLELRIFLDRDGDREKDEIEAYATGAVVSLVDATGRTRDAATDDAGRVRFGNLAPGRYTIRIYTGSGAGADEAPAESVVELGPGEAAETTIAVPLRRREIRFQGSR